MKGHGSIEPEELLGDHQVRGEELLHARHRSLPARQGSGLSDPRTQGTQVVLFVSALHVLRVILALELKKSVNSVAYHVPSDQGLRYSDPRTQDTQVVLFVSALYVPICICSLPCSL